MDLGDRAIGFLLLLFSSTLFAYYTFWVIITVSALSILILHLLQGFTFLNWRLKSVTSFSYSIRARRIFTMQHTPHSDSLIFLTIYSVSFTNALYVSSYILISYFHFLFLFSILSMSFRSSTGQLKSVASFSLSIRA